MFPIFVPDQTPRSRRESLKIVLVGAFAAIGLGALLFMSSSASEGDSVWIVASVIVMLFVVFGVLLVRRNDTEAQTKAKRGMEGLDLYSVIDRLVEDLDEDEAAYLQRRLDEREAKQKNDLTVSLDDLLQQRASQRGLDDE